MNILTDKNILFEIFDYLDAKSLGHSALVNKQWNLVYKTNKFTYKFSHNIFGNAKINNTKLHLIKNSNDNFTSYSEFLTDEGLIGLSTFNNITDLYLGNNSGMKITDKSIIFLANKLEKLSLFRCESITDLSIKKINGKIKLLDISCNDNITDHAFKNFNSVEIFSISCCSKITDNILNYVASPMLKYLTLPDQIKSFKALKSCQLTSLSLFNCQILDNELKYINADNLKVLRLTHCANITDVGIEILARGKHMHFDELSLRNTKITDASLIYVSAVDLDIWGTKISDEGFVYITKTKILSIGEMKCISEKCLQYLFGLTELLAPRTSITQEAMKIFQNQNPHIHFII